MVPHPKPSNLTEFHAGLTDYLSWWNTTRIQERLGYLSPDEYRAQEIATAETSITKPNIRGPLHSWLGSKGWNSKRKTTAKAKPHLPSAMLREHLRSRPALPRAVRPLDEWLRKIVSEHERSPL